MLLRMSSMKLCNLIIVASIKQFKIILRFLKYFSICWSKHAISNFYQFSCFCVSKIAKDRLFSFLFSSFFFSNSLDQFHIKYQCFPLIIQIVECYDLKDKDHTIKYQCCPLLMQIVLWKLGIILKKLQQFFNGIILKTPHI